VDRLRRGRGDVRGAAGVEPVAILERAEVEAVDLADEALDSARDYAAE
jgi:hypothetical protein